MVIDLLLKRSSRAHRTRRVADCDQGLIVRLRFARTTSRGKLARDTGFKRGKQYRHCEEHCDPSTGLRTGYATPWRTVIEHLARPARARAARARAARARANTLADAAG